MHGGAGVRCIFGPPEIAVGFKLYLLGERFFPTIGMEQVQLHQIAGITLH